MSQLPHVVTVGNEKGGSGKSTTAMHVVTALLHEGMSVGSMDLDNRQWTLTRYAENRIAFVERTGIQLPLPEHAAIEKSAHGNREEAEDDEQNRFAEAFGHFAEKHDFIVIDCAGGDSYLGRLAHTVADTLITPLNDSFVDLDLLAEVDPDSLEIRGPSVYAEMVWDQRKQKAMRGRGTIDWVVMRNRLSSIESRNKRDMAEIMERLASRIKFRTAPGFGERVIYRELFLNGLTLMDLRDVQNEVTMTMSHVAARQEIRKLLRVLNLPGVTLKFDG